MGATERCALSAIRAALLALITLHGHGLSAQRLLQRKVEVHAQRIELGHALDLIARDGRFKLSYNAASMNGDSLVDVSAKGTAEEVMRGVLGERFAFKESGEHIILLDGRRARSLAVQGMVIDGATLRPVAGASVFAVQAGETTVTGADGRFAFPVEGSFSGIALRIGRAAYHDTVVYAGRDGKLRTVALRAQQRPSYIEPICTFERCGVEDLGVARLLVPARQMDQAANLDFAERRRFQASLWPAVGTNKEISGAVVNRTSFNLIAGYARGLEGVELGGGVNLERNYVKGAQVAGLANLVGGDTWGVQVAGGLNHTMRSLEGLQVAGLGNTVWDTLSGVQIAGGANVVKGGMRGTQVAGAVNVTTQNVDGVQVAGGFNVTVKDVRKTQAAGAGNYGRNVSGAQVAGGMNMAVGNVGGGQVAGAFNYARNVTGGQVAGGVNVAVDTVRGGQVGVLNFARVVRGGQVGILNFSDTITGGSVGLFSFARRGYHRFDASTNDAMPLSLRFRTGMRVFHNILGFSPAVAEDGRWGLLYGFGSEPRIGARAFLDIDLTAEQVVEQRAWVDAVNILGRLEMRVGLRPFGPVVVSTGPVINLLATDWRDADTGAYFSRLAPSSVMKEWRSGSARFSTWWGWTASLGVRF